MKCKSTSSHKIVKQSRYKAKQVISVLWKTAEQNRVYLMEIYLEKSSIRL